MPENSSSEPASNQIMLALYGLNAFINIVGISLNVGLISITLRNSRLHSTCFLLIGFCSFCSLLLLTQHFIPFFVLLLPQGTVKLLDCFLLHILPLYGVFNVISLIGVIGLDRLLSVFFPFWYAHRNEKFGLASMIGLSSTFPLAILSLILTTVLKQPQQQTVCTLNELLGDNTSLVAALCLLCNFLAVFCYAIVWAKLKRDLRGNGANAESWKHYVLRHLRTIDHKLPISSRQPIFKSLSIIVAIQVGGWCISELAFAYIFFKLDKGSPKQRHLAAAVNCFICVVASVDPVVLFCTSEEYRKAFCQQFPPLSRLWLKIKRSSTTIGQQDILDVQRRNTQSVSRSSFSRNNNHI